MLQRRYEPHTALLWKKTRAAFFKSGLNLYIDSIMSQAAFSQDFDYGTTELKDKQLK